jgi:hypothetical protein
MLLSENFALGLPPRCDGCVYVLIESRPRGVKCFALLKRKPEIILLQAREALAGFLSAKTRSSAQAVSGSSVCMPGRKQVQATLSRRRITERDLK